ncbi:uncharacterized protein [Argopecten irradians]|uniref:uncharacterized protein n=1 Tax=Argopecten irradians TaxID=31199 RepID=UPI00371FDC00
MFKELAVILSLCMVLVSARTSCTRDDQCGTNECCYYHEGPLIMSRKRQDLAQMSLPLDLSLMHQGGYCESYKQLNDHCNVFAKMNGHCECGAGLVCKFVSSAPDILTAPDTLVASKRGMVYQGPGSYQCVRQ